MATVTEPPVVPEVAVREAVLLTGISWETYELLLRDLEESGSNVRMTYDQGRLELMSPARKHERPRHKIGRMIEVVTEELGIPIEGGGSTTLRGKLKKRGLEPDECYWIQNEARVRGLDEINLDTDPPPDLAIEVENTRRLIERMPVYAALGFPEVWRYDGRTLQAGLLQADGTYAWGERSACLPFLPLGELVRFLGLAGTMDETSWIRSFRAWVRAELVPPPG